MRDQEIGLIWADAHRDLHRPATSTSGNVHGMPLAVSARSRTVFAAVMKRALQVAPKGTRGFDVSFDLDVCDPAIAPGVEQVAGSFRACVLPPSPASAAARSGIGPR